MAVRLSRRKITSYIAKQIVAGVPVAELATALAGFLIENKRTNETDLVVRDIEYELSSRGIVLAEITTAFKLSQETSKTIEAYITSQTNADSVRLTHVIDPRVLGGLRIDLPGRQLDSTIARRLSLLRTNDKK
jgi:F-type H+-transporting ATPase subunit delta